MNWEGKWIRCGRELDELCPQYEREFRTDGRVRRATLSVSAMGVYEAHINGVRVSDYVLAPGWTAYDKRIQYQQYDVTDMLKDDNEISITVGRGWYRNFAPQWTDEKMAHVRPSMPPGLIAQLELEYADGSRSVLGTDGEWQVFEGCVRESTLYDGEVYDASFEKKPLGPAVVFDGTSAALVPQQGEKICEHEVVRPRAIIHTPAGETVIDFGQNLTGYVSFTLKAAKGDVVELSHGEVLDKDGNFYNANYRHAKAKLTYICREGEQTYKPHLTFYGFRYIRLDKFPGDPADAVFAAIVVHSDIKPTGRLSCGDETLNSFFRNVMWGQKSNFLDVPTDCPQRDERLGWTGDAQIFIKAACYQYDTEKFFVKWLTDLALDQYEDGTVPHVIPDVLGQGGSSGWDEASTVCPWQIYLSYGNKQVLRDQFISMKKHVDHITAVTEKQYLWVGGFHFGDWVGLDAEEGSYKGASREDFIATAYYAHSTALVVKAGRILGEDVSGYETLYDNIIAAFRRTFTDYRTQTEMVLAAHFSLSENPQAAADMLAERVKKDGHLMTGFIGTPYLLHVLSDYGHRELAYSLLLRREYPGWLYPVLHGATTVWEHWDSIRADGSFWSIGMNSFNHYAYGSVVDWVYEKAAGIRVDEKHPGWTRVNISPLPDRRLGWLRAEYESRQGRISSAWSYENGAVRYEISTPVPATVTVDGISREVEPGEYIFFGKE